MITLTLSLNPVSSSGVARLSRASSATMISSRSSGNPVVSRFAIRVRMTSDASREARTTSRAALAPLPGIAPEAWSRRAYP